MSKMTVDEALDLTARLVKESVDTDTVTHLDRVLITLHTEVRRLRAGVEAVRGLITYDAERGGYVEGGPFVYRDDVLAALEATDAD